MNTLSVAIVPPQSLQRPVYETNPDRNRNDYHVTTRYYGDYKGDHSQIEGDPTASMAWFLLIIG